MATRIRKQGDLIRTSHILQPSRRGVLRGTAGLGAAAATGGLGMGRAMAAETIDFMGWLGYDAFLEAGDYLPEHDLAMEKTFINAPEEIVARLRQAPQEVDICVPYFLHLDFMAEQGLIQPLDLDKLPAWKDLFPTILKVSEGNMTHDGQWYSAPFTWASINLMYNPKLVTQAPTSWRDMLKPEWKGKVAIPADLPSAFSTWGRIATGAAEPNRMTHEQLRQTVDFMIDMKKNQLRTIAASYGELIDLLAREEIVMAQGFEAIAAWIGEPEIRYVYPEEGCMTFVEGWSISAGSKDPDAVHGLINNSLELTGQLAGAEANGMPVTNEKALPQLSDWNRAAYPYEDIESYFNTKLRVDKMYLLEPDGVHGTWDDYIAGWEDVLKA